MKKLLLTAIIASSSFMAMAELEGNGYYRVENAVTKRYAYLVDNKGSINAGAATVDVQALELYLGFSKASSDPATIFYLTKIDSSRSKNDYDIAAPGTSLHSFLNEYIKIKEGKVIDGQQSYYAYGTSSAGAKYLGDRRSDPEAEKGLASADAGGDNRLWYILPVKADSSDSYFGVAPSLECNGKYYYPMFAGFPYDAYSEGIKFYTITRINPWSDEPAVGLKELKGVVPAGTPVIIECSKPLPSDNRLNVGPSGEAADIQGNMLKGVYFDNDDAVHYNRTAYDKKTMRMLTVKNGKLVFDVTDIDFLPRNQAYLQLSTEAQFGVESYEVVTEEEYESKYSGVVEIGDSSVVDVYTLDGRLIGSGLQKEAVSSLGKGLYILRRGSSSEKLIVR